MNAEAGACVYRRETLSWARQSEINAPKVHRQVRLGLFSWRGDPLESSRRAAPMHSDPSPDEASPYEILLGRIDDVIAEWRTLVEKEPWARIPPARLVDALPEILPKIVRAARAGAFHVDKPLGELIARGHGFLRREDSIPLGAVAEEWSHVKHACWNVLRSNGVSEETALGVVRRLDVLVDDAVGHTLRGYYAPELDSLRGRGLERRDGATERRVNPSDRRTTG
jgi:hypothetical protein